MRKVQKTNNIVMLLVVISLIVIICCCTGCSCSSSSNSSQEQEQDAGYFTEIPDTAKHTLTGSYSPSNATLVYDNVTKTVYYMIYGQKGNLNITPYIIEGKYTVYQDGIIKKIE